MGRITAGVGIGIASTMVPVYQAEIVRAQLPAKLPPTNVQKGSKRDPWPGGITSTMGDHLGYPDPILHPIWSFFHWWRGQQCPPRHRGIPHSLGGPDCAGCCSLRRDVLHAIQYVINRVYQIAFVFSRLRICFNHSLPFGHLLHSKNPCKPILLTWSRL